MRVERLFPRDFLSAVGRHPAHQPEEGAGGHALAVVEDLTGTDGAEELAMLLDIHRVVAEALVVAMVVVVVDEGADRGLELAGQEVVLQQDAVLQGLVPALDLALGLRVVRRAADVGDALALEPAREIAGDVGRAVVAEQPGPVDDLARCRSPRPPGRAPACR